MDGFYVFQTIRSVLNWHILRISSGTGKAWNMPEYQNMKRLLYPVYSRNCLSISDYGLGRRLPRILRMNSDKKRSNPLTDDESISVTAHVITNIKNIVTYNKIIVKVWTMKKRTTDHLQQVSIPIEISILFGNSEHPFPERKNMPFRSRVQPFI